MKGEEYGWWKQQSTANLRKVFAPVCDYGVITRGDTFWLNYYAKGLAAPLTEKNSSVKAICRLRSLPKLVKNEVELQALYEGKPVKNAEFYISIDGSEKKTDGNEERYRSR